MTGIREPLIALVGATMAAIPPTTTAFASEFPEATLWNVLDDRLIAEALEAGGLTPPLIERMSRLISYALDAGADGVLLTCSMYGPVAHELARTAGVPLYASDDAAFEAVISGGYSRVLLLSSLPVPLADARTRFDDFLREHEAGLEVTNALAPDAFERSVDGDVHGLAASLAVAVHASPVTADVILLAQYSLAPATDALAELTGIPVLAGPPRAAAKMRSALLGAPS